MANKPTLIKINETVYGCSACKDFKIELQKRHKKTAAEWQRRLDNHFADHLKQRHAHEGT